MGTGSLIFRGGCWQSEALRDLEEYDKNIEGGNPGK